MPSEIAQTIVNHIFGDEKAKAVDAMNDALSASAYDAIQQHKIEFAKTHGFNPDDTDVGTGMVGAPACGDVMKLQIKCRKEGNKHIINDVKFKTYGCGSAIASSAELVQMLIGKTLDEAKAIRNKDLAEVLELPPIKIHCSVLAEDSIKQAIEDYEAKQ